MSEIKDTIWDMKPRTSAKHAILQEYLKAWFPIISKWDGRLVYLDGFAGPGVYSKGEEGSPLIALHIANEHIQRANFREIIFWFIEKNKKRAENLESVLKQRFPDLPPNLKYTVEKSEFAPSLSAVLDNIERVGAKLAPTFAFIDPFGFAGVPMRLIAKMLDYKKCEVLITFMSGFVHRFTDEIRQDALDELFGTNKWKQSDEIRDAGKKIIFLLNLYVCQLKNAGNAAYVRTFEMRNKDNQVVYHLVFGTKHWRGLEVMKEAMFKIDKRGTFRFSDKTDVQQTFLLDYGNEDIWVSKAADMVFSYFQGKTVSVDDIHEYVVIQTPYVFRKQILIQMETMTPWKIMKVSGRKQQRKFPDSCEITFSKNFNDTNTNLQ